MSQLIALIIAIALGAIVTAIGYVFLGDAFSNNSLKGQVQQLINQGQQLELAFTAYKASNGKSAYDEMIANNVSASYANYYEETNDLLVNENYLKSSLSKVIPMANYQMLETNTGTRSKVLYQIDQINDDICAEINTAAGLTPTDASSYTVNDLDRENRFICYADQMFGWPVFAYVVE